MSNPFFDRSIVNSPYQYPRQHWELDETGEPTGHPIDRRRRAEFITPIQKPKSGASGKRLLDNLKAVAHSPATLQGIGMSPLPPQTRAAKGLPEEYRIYQVPVNGRKIAMSVMPSPS
jgi:hypothetical protein